MLRYVNAYKNFSFTAEGKQEFRPKQQINIMWVRGSKVKIHLKVIYPYLSSYIPSNMVWGSLPGDRKLPGYEGGPELLRPSQLAGQIDFRPVFI